MKTSETHSLFLSDVKTQEFLSAVSGLPDLRWEVNCKKHSFSVIDEMRNPHMDIRLPLPLPPIKENQHPEEYLNELEELQPPYLIALIQAGAAALGYIEDGEIYLHKNIKKYMKRHNGENLKSAI